MKGSMPWQVNQARQWCVTRRHHLSQLLEGLATWTRHAALAMAAKHTACLLQLAELLAYTNAGLVPHLVPSQFGNVLEDAGQQCAALCIDCACHQIQVVNLRLATSDLFDVQAASVSGTPPARMPWLTCTAKHSCTAQH